MHTKHGPHLCDQKPQLCNSRQNMHCKTHHRFSFKKIQILRFVREADHWIHASYGVIIYDLRKLSRNGSSCSGIRASQQGEEWNRIPRASFSRDLEQTFAFSKKKKKLQKSPQRLHLYRDQNNVRPETGALIDPHDTQWW